MNFKLDDFGRGSSREMIRATSIIVAGIVPILAIAALYIVYSQFRIDVPAKHFAVLTTKTGEDLDNSEEIAPDEEHRGLQLEVLPGRKILLQPVFLELAGLSDDRDPPREYGNPHPAVRRGPAVR